MRRRPYASRVPSRASLRPQLGRRPKGARPTAAYVTRAAACSSSGARSQPGWPQSSPASSAFGGTAVDKVGGAVSDQFGSFPVRSVDPVPDVPPDEWVVKVDGLVDPPLTIDRATWAGLQRMKETVDFNCVEGWGWTTCAGAAWHRRCCSTRPA